MKSYQKFLEEISVHGHSGLPSDYLKDVEKRKREEHSRLTDSGLMRSAQKLRDMCKGKEEELSKFITNFITDMYRPVIEAYDITLDIKLCTAEEMKREQEQSMFWQKSAVKHYKKKDKNPTIVARAVDLSVLIHEAVKGIYKVLSSGATPDDPELAEDMIKKITFEEEPEDWRYGPLIASDLTQFVNQNPKTNKFPNVKEEVWKIMCDKDTMSSDEFVDFFKGILMKTDEARKKMDSIIDSVVRNLERWHKEMDEYKRQMEEYERKKKEYDAWVEEQKKKEEEEFYADFDPEDYDEEGEMFFGEDEDEDDEDGGGISDDDYWEMDKRELEDEIDKALGRIKFSSDSEKKKIYELVNKLNNIKTEKYG